LKAEALLPHRGGVLVERVNHEDGRTDVEQRAARAGVGMTQHLVADARRVCGARELREQIAGWVR
jgi:hypothetical protein